MIRYLLILIGVGVLVMFGVHFCTEQKFHTGHKTASDAPQAKEAAVPETTTVTTPAPTSTSTSTQPVAPVAGQDQSALEKQVQDLTKRIQQDQKDSDAYFQRAVVYTKLQHINSAIDDYTAVLAINSKSAKALFNRSQLYAKQGQRHFAIRDLNDALGIYPDPRYYNARGLLEIEADDLDNAMQDLNQSIKLDPKYDKAYYNRGTLYERQRLFKEAKADYDQAIANNKKDEDDADDDDAQIRLTEIYYRRSIVNTDLGDNDNALNDANYVVQHSPRDARGYNLRAAIYDRLGNTAAASNDETTAQSIEMQGILKK